MPNDENKIILEFPATNVEIELGETITFDNISGFLNSDRVTYNGESLTDEITHLENDKADASYVDTELANKMNKANPVGTGSFSFNRREGSTVGDKSVALGDRTIASGANSFTSGYGSVASGAKSTAMGSGNRASGSSSMAINSSNTASGDYSLAQGGMCEATEYCSHAEGYSSKASGYVSHAEGQGTIANHISQHTSGEFNIPDDSSNPEYSRGKYVEIVGNGTDDNNRSNARTLDWQGNETLAGDLTYNGNKRLSSEISRLDNRITDLPEAMVFKGTLGVGGTIETLPTASAENEGWMFKCITAGTYAGLTLKVGDTVTCFNPPNTSTYYWDKTGSQDTDTDTWRNIKVNGVEKLGNGISSGAVDFEDTANVKFEFDANGNKIKAKLDGIYTDSEVDDLLDDKADADNTYTKAQVDDIVYGILPDDTASGSVANFNTSLALPIKSLEIDVNAVQDLHGQSNPYPAGGGVNKFDKDTMVIEDAYINDTDGTQRVGTGSACTDYIEINPNTSYYIKSEQTQGQWGAWYDENKTFISGINGYNSVKTSPANAKYVRFTCVRAGSGNINTFSVNYPSTDTAYHPYENICPISGRSEINRYKLGGNFFNKNAVTNGFLISASGNEVSYADWNLSDYIEVVEGASYYLYGLTTHPNTNQDNFELFDENKNKVGFANVKTTEQPYVIPSGVKYIKCSVKNPDLDTAQLGVSVNASYVPYNPVIEKTVINLGGTYYGGYVTEDKEGHRQFVVTHSDITDLGSFTWNSSAEGYTQSPVIEGMKKTASGSTIPDMLCDTLKVDAPSNVYNKVSDGSISIAITTANSGLRVYLTTLAGLNASQVKSALTGIYIAYPLETPIVIDLPDGEPIITLNGTNNIYADTGDTEVVFKSSVNDYVSAHSGGNLLGMGGVYLGGAKSGGSEEETDNTEDTEKTKLDEPKEEIKTIGDVKKLGGE